MTPSYDDDYYGTITYSTIDLNITGFSAFIGGVLLPDGRVIFVPHYALSIGILNSITNVFSTIPGAPGYGAYIDGVLLPDNRVIFVPYFSPTIGIFNSTNNTFSTILGTETAQIPGHAAYSGGVLVPDGRVIFVPYFAKTIGIFNSLDNSYSTISSTETAQIRGEGAYQGGILVPDGRVIFIPFLAKTIGIFDPKTNIYTTLPELPASSESQELSKSSDSSESSESSESKLPKLPGNGGYMNGVLLHDGRIVFIPHNTLTVGIFDPVTNIYSTIDGIQTLNIWNDKNININNTNNEMLGHGCYAGGVLLPDGRVIFVPHFSSIIIIFDPTTNTFNTFSGRCDSAYQGGILLQDGRVIFFPRHTRNIGVLTFSDEKAKHRTQTRLEKIKEELLAVTWHPKRMLSCLDYNERSELLHKWNLI
uniref:Uncharacterized protein n=1 Tax=viral metagenome TaxID=1070528 RepID=A0A6C0LY93_9ZZZZ